MLTIGHGTQPAEDFAALLRQGGIESLVDVRSAPGSRRHPQFSRNELQIWVPEAGTRYRWEPRLGGFRRPSADSPNIALRHPSFREYADYMMSEEFGLAMTGLVDEVRKRATAVMCSETLWWRCHRRLIADAAVLLFGLPVTHLGLGLRQEPHRVTDGARVDAEKGCIIYDGPQGLALEL